MRNTITVNAEWDDDNECWVTIELPAHVIVCPRCGGRGAHVNPAIDGHGISTSDECWQDDDFRDNYFGGLYDVTCEQCEGRNVVLVINEDACDPEQLARYHQHQRDRWDAYASDRSEAIAFGYN